MTQSAIMTFVTALSFTLSSALAQQIYGQGKWESLSSTAIGGTWEGSFVQTGDHLEGTFVLKGSNVLSGGEVAGYITGSQIALEMAGGQKSAAEFSGKMTGDNLAGEWSSEIAGDHGIWYGRLSKAKMISFDSAEDSVPDQ